MAKTAFTSGLIDRIYKRPLPDQPNVIENLLPNPADVLGGQGAGNGGYIKIQFEALEIFPLMILTITGGFLLVEYFSSPNNNDTSLQEMSYAVEHFFLPRRYNDPFVHTTTVTFDSTNDLLIIRT